MPSALVSPRLRTKERFLNLTAISFPSTAEVRGFKVLSSPVTRKRAAKQGSRSSHIRSCKIGGQRGGFDRLRFAFLGGTMGSVVGEKIAHAFEEATERRIP